MVLLGVVLGRVVLDRHRRGAAASTAGAPRRHRPAGPRRDGRCIWRDRYDRWRDRASAASPTSSRSPSPRCWAAGCFLLVRRARTRARARRRARPPEPARARRAGALRGAAGATALTEPVIAERADTAAPSARRERVRCPTRSRRERQRLLARGIGGAVGSVGATAISVGHAAAAATDRPPAAARSARPRACRPARAAGPSAAARPTAASAALEPEVGRAPARSSP